MVPGDPAQAGGDALEPVQAQNGDCEVAERCEDLGCTADADLGAVLIEHPVSDPMAPILYAPVATDVAGELCWSCLLGAQVSHVVGGLRRLHVAVEVGALALGCDKLRRRGEAQWLGEPLGDRNDAEGTVLDAPVTAIVGLLTQPVAATKLDPSLLPVA